MIDGRQEPRPPKRAPRSSSPTIPAEEELRAVRRNLEAIYQASGDGLALCEATFGDDGRVAEYQVLEVNRAHAQLTGASREQMLAQPISTIYPPIDSRWFDIADVVLKTGVMHNFDIRSRATGRWLNVRVSRVSDRLFHQTFVDVTDRHLLEEQRRELLQEMSHRVMNNFQMIAGFLHLQAVDAEPPARDQLQSAERRVQVLAKLHSLLTYHESFAEVDAGAYVRELCRYLGSANDRPHAVRVLCEADDLSLPTEVLVPIGFIVTELVTNGIKYAYPPPLAGAIHVNFERRHRGWVLTIRDHGRGLPEGSPVRPGGLGWRLVNRFIRQLGAELATTNEGGVRHEITFKTA